MLIEVLTSSSAIGQKEKEMLRHQVVSNFRKKGSSDKGRLGSMLAALASDRHKLDKPW